MAITPGMAAVTMGFDRATATRPSWPRFRGGWRRLAAVALGGASMLLAWIAIRLLLAALFGIQADAFITDWDSYPGDPSPPAWEVAQQAATLAIALFPATDGAYLDRLGRVYAGRNQARAFGDPTAVRDRQDALATYRRASAARPLWPWTWTHIAYAKLALGERDGEFRTALHQAHALGPWLPSINRSIAEIGLLAWRSLDSETRTLTLEAGRRVARGGAADAKWLADVATRSGRVAIVCAALPGELDLEQRLCKQR
jgi:hypothetical protein